MKKIEFETFREMTDWLMDQLKEENPFVFNGKVCLNKFRVTVEPVIEKESTVVNRANKLFRESKNMHHRTALVHYMGKLGYSWKGARVDRDSEYRGGFARAGE